MDDPEPSFILLNNFLQPFTVEIAIYLAVLLVLILFSALISGSEVAVFSLGPSEKEEIEESDNSSFKSLQKLINKPKELLATILVANNFINIAIILISTAAVELIFDLSQLSETALFIIQVIGITFLILLFGEVIPKVYATKHGLKLAKLMAKPLVVLEKIFKPISQFLIISTNVIDKRVKKKSHDFSVEELSHALDLTDDIDTEDEEHRLLKGIVKFGETSVSEVMTARVNVTSLENDTSFEDVIALILDCGHSRIPVYEDSFDKILGVLYIKDLLPHINQNNYDWQNLIRAPFFVPENKKLDDLLKEFQDKKIHLAVVVDEYGGTSGIITLEDVIEEIVGDINDEFDEEDIAYSKLDEKTYIFDGNTTLNDLSKVVEGIEEETINEMREQADTLAGLIIEISGKIPQKNEKINFKHLQFTIEASDKRRIKRVKFAILPITEAQ